MDKTSKKMSNIKIHLDKVDRKLILKIMDTTPEYRDFEIYQVAKVLLKDALFQKVREKAMFLRLVRVFTINFLKNYYRISNKVSRLKNRLGVVICYVIYIFLQLPKNLR